LDLAYSEISGYLDRATLERILRLLEAIGFKLWDEAMLERDVEGRRRLVIGLSEFREHLGGELHITLLRGIGDGFEVTTMDEADVEAAIEFLERRAARPAEKRLASG
jgi:3-dehydroquinate synthase